MRAVTIPSQEVFEDIASVHHVPGAKVDVVLHRGTMQTIKVPSDPTQIVSPMVDQTLFIPIQGTSISFSVEGPDYAELMSGSPDWSPGKPAGKFRFDDLWHYVDKYRAAQP